LTRTSEVGSRHACEPGAVADVGADAVDRVEHRLEQFVAGVESLCERVARVSLLDERQKRGLIQVLRGRRVSARTRARSVVIARSITAANKTAKRMVSAAR
jgi:hypothetical protein